jgi:hypothetical protein
MDNAPQYGRVDSVFTDIGLALVFVPCGSHDQVTWKRIQIFCRYLQFPSDSNKLTRFPATFQQYPDRICHVVHPIDVMKKTWKDTVISAWVSLDLGSVYALKVLSIRHAGLIKKVECE